MNGFRGVAFCVSASTMFGFLYYFVSFLHPLNGEEVFGWRIFTAFPFLTVILILFGEWHMVRELWERVKKKPVLVIALFTSAGLIGVQNWLFMSAPIRGWAMPVSLGYFMLPLVMVLAGRLFFKEKLSRLQKMATLCAIIGVGNQFYFTGSLSWTTFVVALGMPPYFVLRRFCHIDNLGGLWTDLLILSPVAAWFAFSGPTHLAAIPQLYPLIPILGLVTAMAFICYIQASRLLTISLFGLLTYLEPVLLFFAALLLGERIEPGEMPTYALIWVAVLLLIVDGVRGALQYRRAAGRMP